MMFVNNKFLIGSIFLLCFSGCISVEKKPVKTKTTAPSKPNVIFILADDLGYGDLKCYNEESKIPTPYLDKLANEGMRFTDAHTPSSLCTPTRYGILTGQYAWRSRLKKGVLQSYDLELIEDSIQTIGQVFLNAGYETAHIGKWHLGFDWQVHENYPKKWQIHGLWRAHDRDDRIDLSKGIPGGPINAGFDYSYGFDAPNFPPYCFWENGVIEGQVPTLKKPDSLYGNNGWFQEGWSINNVYPLLENKVLAYLDEVSKKEKPFFLYYALTAPHVPLLPTEDAKGKSQAGLYGDFVVDVDNTIGKICAKLQNLGIDEKTILVFTSDNGSPARVFDPKGNDYYKGCGEVIRQFNHKANGDLRGLKGDIWEGGHRVPMIVRWPDRVKPNTQNNQVVCLTDWYSFACDLTKQEKNKNQGIDSYSLFGTLENPQIKVREQIIHHSGEGKFAVRQGDWKLILTKAGGSGYSKWHDPEGQINEYEGQLYNISEDVLEQNNLYNEYPQKVEDLSLLLNKIKRKGAF
ncbi:arylsulfatase [Sabulilitoribacter arenilitoris]|uniref:Arylsulfatase n=1 Tax=Wocania arenilitoris TaxID=2044858 RepID=A0AAE3EKN2_9FLAO|nr:arylsulfatase [Wocania arenilitoris]MCF7567050.1 arylsulfatase [Wocania arenilitoris]